MKDIHQIIYLEIAISDDKYDEMLKGSDGYLKYQQDAKGYQIPEAFMFNNVQIPGYWATKYTLGT